MSKLKKLPPKVTVVIVLVPVSYSSGSPSPSDDPDKKKPFWESKWYTLFKDIALKWFPVTYTLVTQFKSQAPHWLLHFLHIH
jgi:hypothetical protein